MRAFVSVLLAISLLGAPASAATFKTLYTPVLGTSVIHVEGQITKGELGRLKEAIAEHQRQSRGAETFLSLHSGGGLVQEATAMALHVREAGIGTVLLPKATCASACAVVFFGGFHTQTLRPRRISFEGSKLGVHRSFLKATEAKKDRKYLVDGNYIHQVHEAIQKNIGFLTGVLIWEPHR
jgi:hypothetical protein